MKNTHTGSQLPAIPSKNTLKGSFNDGHASAAGKLLSASMFALVLSSCGWVDSAGNTGQADAGGPLGTSSAAGSNGSTLNKTIELPQLSVLALAEQNTLRITPDAAIGDAIDWSWTPVAQPDVNRDCARLSGFDTPDAVDSLLNACTNRNDCALDITRVNDNSGQTRFDIGAPSLKASAGLGYRLTAFKENGDIYNQNFSFCAISINEAPAAEDDTFTVVRGETRIVQANDLITLLSNDSDDIDIRNKPLSVNPVPVTAPRLAAEFSLFTNGGFVYTPAVDGSRGTQLDRFEYEITDGLQTSRASVTLRIVDSNRTPQLIARLPDLTLVVGQTLAPLDPAYDFSQFFRDPDGTALSFMSLFGSLPGSGNLFLTESGRLIGTPGLEDIGDYRLTVVASDGSDSVDDELVISIVANQSTPSNQPPVISPIDTIIALPGDRISFGITARDDDGDDLIYALSNDSADFLSINSNSGRVSGFAVEAGLFVVTVIVSDSNSSVQRSFIIRIVPETNRAPFVDDISNHTVSDEFAYDVSVFFEDADGDVLTFSATNLPEGVSISPDGIISGVAATANLGRHLIRVTADDGNSGSATDGFRLIITR